MTIDDAIDICKALASKHPELERVIGRIKELREERNHLHKLAEKAMSEAAWQRSDLKKWADKQRLDPDND